MIRDHANRLLLMTVVSSFVGVIFDLAMETVTAITPLSAPAVFWGTVASYLYFISRLISLVFYSIYVFCVTRTEYKIRPFRIRALIWLPYLAVLAMLAQNLFTHNVFTVTMERGYSREPMIIAVYGVASVYIAGGMIYCIYCKKYLTTLKWMVLLSVYVLMIAAVLIQMLLPYLLVEMFSTAVGVLMIMLLVQRPEETMDSSVGIQSWNAYQTDLKNVLISGRTGGNHLCQAWKRAGYPRVSGRGSVQRLCDEYCG